jgi:hypothetical protein
MGLADTLTNPRDMGAGTHALEAAFCGVTVVLAWHKMIKGTYGYGGGIKVIFNSRYSSYRYPGTVTLSGILLIYKAAAVAQVRGGFVWMTRDSRG